MFKMSNIISIKRLVPFQYLVLKALTSYYLYLILENIFSEAKGFNQSFYSLIEMTTFSMY